MPFDPILAEKRFGYGLSPAPDLVPPQSAAEMLDRLQQPDQMTDAFPIEDFATFRARTQQAQEIWKRMRKARGTDQFKPIRKELQLVKKAARIAHRRWVAALLLRRVWTPDAFRERLVAFWGDHFTAMGKAGVLSRATSPYVEASIRPHLTGRFGDLLFAAATSPLMVHYLDQAQSMGPGSDKAKRRGSKAGLNENLAREILELHTLGVGAGYSQGDVRQLAELLTGLTHTPQKGRVFRKDYAEPGAETVLGRSYGGGKPALRDIRAVLDDLAAHPATARHIAQKLAVHFIADTPPADLVDRLERRYLDSGGDLLALYEVLLNHPAAWDPVLHNIRLPEEFISAALRGLAVAPERFTLIKDDKKLEKLVATTVLRPLRVMGQPWQAPLGPDGWAEEDSHWLTPQGLSARLQWGLVVPARLAKPLPDPRQFVDHVLGPEAPQSVRFAAAAAESRREAIALVLASPAFQRR